MAEKKKHEDVWALIGKIGVVIGVLVGIKTLVTPFFSDKPTLGIQTICLPGNILPVGFADAVERAARSASNQVASLDGHHVALAVLRYNTFLQYSIRNTGNSQVSGIVVDTPYEGITQMESAGGRTAICRFTNSITVGSLRPKQKVDVSIWKTDGKDANKTRSQVVVSYDGGVGTISDTGLVGGFDLFLAKYWVFLVFGGMIVYLFGGDWWFERRVKRRLESEKALWLLEASNRNLEGMNQPYPDAGGDRTGRHA